MDIDIPLNQLCALEAWSSAGASVVQRVQHGIVAVDDAGMALSRGPLGGVRPVSQNSSYVCIYI